RHTRSTRDWSSDVCSSDLLRLGATIMRPILQTTSVPVIGAVALRGQPLAHELLDLRDDVVDLEVGRVDLDSVLGGSHADGIALEIGRAACRERGYAWDDAG